MVSENIQTKIVELLSENDNRMVIDEAADALSEKVGAITYDKPAAERDIQEAIKESDELVKDRFGGKDRIEKVVY